MLRRSIISIIAVLAVFVLSLAIFAELTKSYAVKLFGVVFYGKVNSTSKKLKLDAYFEDAEKEKSYSAISGVCKKFSLQQSISSQESQNRNLENENLEEIDTGQNTEKTKILDTGQLDTGQDETNTGQAIIDTGQGKFDLELNTSISKITIQNKSGKTDFNYDKQKDVKLALKEKEFDSSIANIEYTITVTNKGDVEGFAKRIVDYLPKDLEFNPTYNTDWYRDYDGNVYSDTLSNEAIKKGESKSLKLILTKKLELEDIRLVKNTAEIIEAYNEYRFRRYKFKTWK